MSAFETHSISQLITLANKSSKDLQITQQIAHKLQQKVKNWNAIKELESSNGFDILAKYLIHSDPIVRRRSSATVCNIAAIDGSEQLLISSGCIDALFLALKTEKESYVLQNTTAAILNLSIEEKCREYLIEQIAQSIDIIISALSYSKHDPHIAYNLLGTLASLATNVNASANIINNALSMITESLYSKEDKILEGAIAAICNLAINKTNRKALVQYNGLLDRLLELSKTANGELKDSAGRVVQILSTEAQKELSSNMEALIRDLGSSNLDRVCNAAGTICNLCRNNDENKKTVRKKGGLEVLVDAIQRSKIHKNAEAIYKCVTALASVAINNDNCRELCDLKVANQLVDILVDYKTNPRVVGAVLSAMNNLTVLKPNRTMICEKGGIKHVIEFLNSSNKEHSEKACSILINMAVDDQCGEIIRKEGGIQKLYVISQSGDGKNMTSLQKKSIVALWNLSLDEKSQKKSDTHGMVNKTMVTKTKVVEAIKSLSSEGNDMFSGCQDFDGNWKDLIDGMIDETETEDEFTESVSDIDTEDECSSPQPISDQEKFGKREQEDEEELIRLQMIERRRSYRMKMRRQVMIPVQKPHMILDRVDSTSPPQSVNKKYEEEPTEENSKEKTERDAKYNSKVKKISAGLVRRIQSGIRRALQGTLKNYKRPFKEYEHEIFANIRKHAGISDDEFINSVCKGKMKVIITPGKSGALLIFTHDRRYILKTVTKSEGKYLKEILFEYADYLQQHPDTLLCKFAGWYKCSFGKKAIQFVVMNNIFQTEYKMTEVYDLKGSKHKRTAAPDDTVLKDNDFTARKKRIQLGKLKKGFLHQISQDCGFLAYLNVMDYSFLLGIYSGPRNPEDRSNSITGKYSVMESSDGKDLYFCGIIDILQVYNLRKKAERTYKSLKSNGQLISVMPPDNYAKRFEDFITNQVD